MHEVRLNAIIHLNCCPKVNHNGQMQISISGQLLQGTSAFAIPELKLQYNWFGVDLRIPCRMSKFQ